MEYSESRCDLFQRLGNYLCGDAIDRYDERTLDDDQGAVVQHETKSMVELDLVDTPTLAYQRPPIPILNDRVRHGHMVPGMSARRKSRSAR